MFTLNVKKLIVTLLMLAISASAFSSPRNAQKAKAKSVDAAQLEAFYNLLVKRKAYAKRVATASKKPRLIKASYTPSRSSKNYRNHLRVTATAYTSHVGQTDSTPNIAAWGDRLYPGMKSIAVSRDLLNVYGLKHDQKVRIKGLKGEYRVLDKMNKRWRKKIDIYMGLNKRKAFQWGRRKVEIMWN